MQSPALPGISDENFERCLVRRTTARNLRPLTELTIDIISNNYKFLSTKPQAFYNLSAEAICCLFTTLCKDGKLNTPDALVTCVTHNTRELTLSKALSFTEDQWIYVLNRLKTKCQNLTTLAVQLRVIPQNHQTTFPLLKIALDNFIRHLKNLRKLALVSPNFKADNDTLRVIGSSCSKLRILKIMRSEITDQGIQYLCMWNPPLGMCQEITHLSIDEPGPLNGFSKVTSRGLLAALIHLPHLIVLEHVQYIPAIIQYILLGYKVQLENVYFLDPRMMISNYVRQFINSLLKGPLNHIKHLCVQVSSDMNNVPHLPNLESASMYEFFEIKELTAPYILHYLSELNIQNLPANCDISVLAIHCEHLTDLQICFSSSIKCSFTSESSFLRLTNLCIYTKCDDDDTKEVCKLLLSSPKLTKVHLNICIIEDIFVPLIVKALAGEKVFSSIERFVFMHAKNLVIIKKIVLVSPLLCSLYLPRHLDSCQHMRHFLARNGIHGVIVKDTCICCDT